MTDRIPTLLYRDDWLVAMHKPADLLVHPTAQDPTATDSAMQQLRDALGQRVYPVHRLDKRTSGVLLMALDPHTARLLGEAFATQHVSKAYLTLLRGYTDDAGEIDYPLRPLCDRHTGRRTRERPAQPARTTYEALARVELPHPVGRYATARYSFVRAWPHTGRNRQLRRHFKHIFHPIVGDRKHGDPAHNAFFETQWGLRRMLLHAEYLQLTHPHTGAALMFSAPPTGEFARMIGVLGLSGHG